MRSLGSWIGVLLGSSCAEQVPLPEVPIEGGTPQQRAEARQILDAFEADVGEGRVVLSEVRFGSIYGAAGRFFRGSGRIRLDPELRGGALQRALRHELCHALDFGEGLMERPDRTFDALVRELFVDDVIDTDGLGGPRYRRSEAFARYCDVGPLAARALSVGCPGDPPEITAAAGYLARRVWGFPEPPGPGLREPHASWTAPAPDPEVFDALGTTDPSRIRVLYGTPEGLAVHTLDIDGGQRLDGGGAALFAPDEPLPEGLADLCPLSGDPPSGAGWSGGPAAARVRLGLYGVGTAPRILATDGEGWAPIADGCVPYGPAALFATPDRELWLAWVDERTVSWAPLSE